MERTVRLESFPLFEGPAFYLGGGVMKNLRIRPRAAFFGESLVSIDSVSEPKKELGSLV